MKWLLVSAVLTHCWYCWLPGVSSYRFDVVKSFESSEDCLKATESARPGRIAFCAPSSALSPDP
jgi:hypothetical protein